MNYMIVLALLLASPAPTADERRLDPAEVERILEEAARKRVAGEQTSRRAIEGEVGVSVGSRGYRQVFGTAIVPVGQDATAVISIGSEERPRRSSRPRR